jgi:hypothetical protein
VIIRGEDEDKEAVPGIPHHQIFERLFLTSRKQKIHVSALEKYLENRERYAAKYNFPPYLDGYIYIPKFQMSPPVWTVHKDCFAVRFSERSRLKIRLI